MSIGDTHTSHKRVPVAEPNIDFELDIKLDVDCGKCALHPKDTETEVKRWESEPEDCVNFYSQPFLIIHDLLYGQIKHRYNP